MIHLAEDVDLTPIELPEIGFLDAEAAQGGLLDHLFVNVGYGFNSLDRSFSSPQSIGPGSIAAWCRLRPSWR